MSGFSLRQWASSHPGSTRWLIALLYTAVGITLFFYGLMVVGTGMYEAGWPLVLCVAGLGAMAALRVIWREKAPNRRAFTMYMMAGMLVFAGMNVYLGSRFPVEYGQGSVYSSVESAHAATQLSSNSRQAESADAAEGSWIQKLIRKSRRATKEMPVWAKILLTILVIALVLLVGYITVGLFCALACNDYAVLALLTLIFGWGGGVVGGFFLIKAIWRGRKKNRNQAPAAS